MCAWNALETCSWMKWNTGNLEYSVGRGDATCGPQRRAARLNSQAVYDADPRGCFEWTAGYRGACFAGSSESARVMAAHELAAAEINWSGPCGKPASK